MLCAPREQIKAFLNLAASPWSEMSLVPITRAALISVSETCDLCYIPNSHADVLSG